MLPSSLKLSTFPVAASSISWRSLRLPLLALGFGVGYFFADFALNTVAFSKGWEIIWPLNGITVAILLMRPLREWPYILLGVGVGTGIGECLDNNPLHLEVWLRLCSLLEVFLTAWILPSFCSLDKWLRKPHIFLRFAFALVLGPGVSGLLAAVVFHRQQQQPFLSAFNSWGTADALGMAAAMPLALSLLSQDMRDLFKPRAITKTLLVLGLAMAMTGVIFSVSRYPLLFLLYPTLLLVEAVLAFAGSSIVLVAVAVISVGLTERGYGPFGHWPPHLFVSQNVALQIFLGFNLLGVFPASLLMMERRRMAAELQETNERLRQLASIDGLTGVANRRVLDERFESEWRRAGRVQTPLALLMIDLDHFKQFNDMYGHHEGDQCLRAVAHLLQDHLKRPQDMVARFGGEEFAVLLPHTDLDGARDLAERLRQAVASLAIEHCGSAARQVTVSVGCAAMIPAKGDDPSVLLRAADAALYRAKAIGRNRIATGHFSEPLLV